MKVSVNLRMKKNIKKIIKKITYSSNDIYNEGRGMEEMVAPLVSFFNMEL